jgi:hypothetical protein
MNCEKCHDLLSEFLEGSLNGKDHAVFSAHLEECLSCADVREEMQAIVSVARESREFEVAPPNSRALWLRIRNTIESEQESNAWAASAAARAPRRASQEREGFWAGLLNRRWELSLPQLAASVAVLAIVVSLATAVGVQGWQGAQLAGVEGVHGRSGFSSTQANSFDAASDALYHQSYMQQQETRISYWKQHVEQRKASWNPQMRNAFDRSLNVIEEAVSESASAVERNPHDEVSQEMLNAALRDRMELLREFSEQ